MQKEMKRERRGSDRAKRKEQSRDEEKGTAK